MRGTAALFVLFAGLMAAKDHDWQEGTLISTANNPYFASVKFTEEVSKPGLVASSIARSAAPNSVVDHYAVEGENWVYLVERTRFKTAPSAHIAVGQGVKFAVEKKKLWLMDDDGKPFEASIIDEVRKTPATQTTASLPSR